MCTIYIMNINTILWFFVAVMASAIPVPFIKSYTKDKNIMWIVISIIAYLILILAYTKIFTDSYISVAYPLVKILAILIVALIGFFLFGDKLNMYSILGIFFGIMSICLLAQTNTK